MPRVTIGGSGPAGSEQALTIVRLLQGQGARLLEATEAGHGNAVFTMEVPVDWRPSLELVDEGRSTIEVA
jgi:hypothetical protein